MLGRICYHCIETNAVRSVSHVSGLDRSPKKSQTSVRPRSISPPAVSQGSARHPFHDKTIVVNRCGRICRDRKKINFGEVFAVQAVGIKEVHDDIWLVSFMNYDLGYFDLETRVLEPLENPFGPKVLPM